ncbi:MAG TPA: immunoglobulin-like domain-containing protein [Flavobacterium sp.]|nr:immunoglobulin-like domain-containing protein [Flavobacterium sp.]
MKKIFISLLLVTGGLFVSCDKDESEGLSKTTIYPVITLSGDDPAFVPVGSTYVDPGAVGTVGGNEIELQTRFVGVYRGTVSETLDTNKSDFYNLEYTAENEDGFSATATRQVIVYKTGDLVNSIEGLYTSTTRRNGSLLPASQGSSVDQEYILIWKNDDGTYGVSDAFGGWYALGRSIGVTSATQGGTIAGDIATNTFTFPGNPLTNEYFGGVANITGLTVNPVTKTLVLTCDWVAPGNPPTNYTFVSTLTQVQL